MTNFERTYILNKYRSKIAVERENKKKKKSDVIDLTDVFQKQREEFRAFCYISLCTQG